MMNLTKVCVYVNKVPTVSSVFANRTVRKFHAVTSNLQPWITPLDSKHSLKTNLPTRFISSLNSKSVQVESEVKQPLIERILNKIPFINIEKSRLNIVGFMLYESIADKINYADFFEEFSLPDTFYSWFVVTELHLWILAVRCMAEGEDGRFVRNKIVQALWTDVGLRVKKIGAVNPAEMRMQVAELSEQFQAALIAYDEGIQSDDVVLAGAIWRRMYQKQEVCPEHLDALIKYIRRQMRLLDSKSRSEIFTNKLLTWEPISEKQ